MKFFRSKSDRRKRAIQLSLSTIFYLISMSVITVSVLFFINNVKDRNQYITELSGQKNALTTLQAKQAIIRTKILKLLFLERIDLSSEILSATEDYDFILNSFISIANKNKAITDISLYHEVTASFAQLRELGFQLIRYTKENKLTDAINLYQTKYMQRENLISVFVDQALYGKEDKINALNTASKTYEKLFTLIFLAEILVTLIITYLINRQVNIRLNESNKHLKSLASRDVLTGLYNRRLFIEQLDYLLELMHRNNQKLILLFIDLDGFKLINDTHGHLIGDKVLIDVAKRIRDSVRMTDMVYRLGGDEFTVIIENPAKIEDYKTVAKKLIQSLGKPYFIENKELLFSASIGVSIYPEHGNSIDLIVGAADAAMYHVKSKGKNNYLCFSKDMQSEVNYCTQLKSDLRKAVSNGELFLHYQPKIDLATETLVGCEALVRWQHPTKGIISPAKFIPMAEETGCIIDIGLWVIQAVSAQIVDWRQRNINIPQVAINLSGLQLGSPESFKNIIAVLAKNPFPPSMLEFELTESVIMGYQSTDAFQSLLTLKEAGHNISIDDFGTGYSSLSYLKHLPVDTLKIDRSFITDVIERPDGRAIVKAIIALAISLELKTVAEGVETQLQLDFLKACGCDQVQGYYFSKPLSVKEIEAFNVEQLNSNLFVLN